ncbi:MAG: hypothetical protein EBR02_03145 [Alphaproteobacteria bacterium]|nr:hypothetical protein [Alphaproteobacteria bacterium]
MTFVYGAADPVADARAQYVSAITLHADAEKDNVVPLATAMNEAKATYVAAMEKAGVPEGKRLLNLTAAQQEVAFARGAGTLQQL